ncbi:hypothetical protein B0T22DRAFT_200073 [Podospora appendiculata]|uniref:Uncharacterized protein n=1 Tax=Podospora appendiculata TaxID=314037 RepID=A0AAE1C9V6_9PEZI|nr:hypothetical protein B0T22DRAFT_200073 [Podospora appendiculata]
MQERVEVFQLHRSRVSVTSTIHIPLSNRMPHQIGRHAKTARSCRCQIRGERCWRRSLSPKIDQSSTVTITSSQGCDSPFSQDERRYISYQLSPDIRPGFRSTETAHEWQTAHPSPPLSRGRAVREVAPPSSPPTSPPKKRNSTIKAIKSTPNKLAPGVVCPGRLPHHGFGQSIICQIRFSANHSRSSLQLRMHATESGRKGSLACTCHLHERSKQDQQT